jgi:phenylacetate-CoA ligase
MRTVFEEVYNCKTFDGWSGVEACGLISECEQGSLHISSDAGIIEVLDDLLKPAPLGIEGTVFCTGLLNQDQPLIRYNIGDRIILSKKVCSCGRMLPVVQEILGRVEDVVLSCDGKEMVRFHSVFNNLETVRQAQVIQETLDRIHIKVVSDKLSIKDKNLIMARLISQLGKMNITIEEVDEIQLNKNGKFQAVISKLNRN